MGQITKVIEKGKHRIVWTYDTNTDFVEEDNFGGGFGLDFKSLEKLYLWAKKQRETFKD